VFSPKTKTVTMSDIATHIIESSLLSEADKIVARENLDMLREMRRQFPTATLRLHPEITAATTALRDQRIVCAECFVPGRRMGAWSIQTLKTTKQKLADHVDNHSSQNPEPNVDNRTALNCVKRPRCGGDDNAVESCAPTVLELPVHFKIVTDALVAVATVFGMPIARLAPGLKLSEYVAALESAMDSRANGVLSKFLSMTFGHFDSTDALLRSFPCQRDALVHWLECGAQWAPMCSNEGNVADRVHDARRFSINSVFFALDAALKEKDLNLDASLVGNDNSSMVICSSAALRTSDVVSIVRGALASAANGSCSRFVQCARRVVAMALPLDAFYALFHDRKHWFSKRHWQLMHGAVQHNCADANVRALVCALAAKTSIPAMSLAEIETFDFVETADEATATLEKRVSVDITAMAAVDTMMNKHYELAFALCFSADDVAATRAFNMPMFWVPVATAIGANVETTMRVCCVDLTRLPLKLRHLQ